MFFHFLKYKHFHYKTHLFFWLNRRGQGTLHICSILPKNVVLDYSDKCRHTHAYTITQKNNHTSKVLYFRARQTTRILLKLRQVFFTFVERLYSFSPFFIKRPHFVTKTKLYSKNSIVSRFLCSCFLSFFINATYGFVLFPFV